MAITLPSWLGEADFVEAADEMYIASIMVIDSEHEEEKTYLVELADALNLSCEVVSSLQKAVG